MTWRCFVSEALVDGELVHTLECSHTVKGVMTKTGYPVRRRWCPTCWKTEPRYLAREAMVLKLGREDVVWLHALLTCLPPEPGQEPHARVLKAANKLLGY